MSSQTNVETKSFSVQTIVKISLLSAIAFLLMLFEIPLPFAPAFYKLGLDEVAVLIAALAMGPAAGIAVEVMKIVLNLIFHGTVTAFVGELSNLLVGLSFILPASIYYQKHKTKHGAFIGMALGTIGIMIGGALCNYFIALPAYEYFMNFPMQAIVGMGAEILPLVHDKLTFILFMTVPFNLFKGLVTSGIVALIYKRISPILHQ